MTNLTIIIIFIAGYLLIAFEQRLRLDKAAAALVIGVLCWTVYISGNNHPALVSEKLLVKLGDISSILFFLLGAMTIVELIDSHNGFDFVTRKIGTKHKGKLLLIVAFLSFILSAFLDNLTTAIVMISLCSKLIPVKRDRFWFAGMIIIGANAGGAWSPLGDVTTTMLWIGGQVSAIALMKQLLIPSIAVCFIPAFVLMRKFGKEEVETIPPSVCTERERKEGGIVLVAGVSFLLFVPLFKTLTHLPPFMGMLLVLGCMWIITTILHSKNNPERAERYTVTRALQKVDTPGILFFLGILLAISALESTGILRIVAVDLTNHLRNQWLIGISLGLLSSFVDNVPLVAASQGMYSLNDFPMDHPFWEFLALTTGTGGSATIIGSAAGVAAMGIEKIDFIRYLKKISWLAVAGFFSGILVFLLLYVL
ncbi:MAG: sodium:proton antiporter NhaD [Chitinophagaceae bacterium]